jgi:hypothetical protein
MVHLCLELHVLFPISDLGVLNLVKHKINIILREQDKDNLTHRHLDKF